MAKGIRALLDTVMQALPQVGNLGLLFFLLFFIFAALGVELFGRLECSDEMPCQGLGEHAHFANFGMAFLTLFRVATGDNWNGIMKDTLRDNCDDNADCVKNCCVSTIIAPIFFVIFVLMAQFVLVNVVVAVLMKHLEESHKQMEDELDMEVELERELQQEQEELEEELCLQALEAETQPENRVKRPLGKVLSLPANFIYHTGISSKDSLGLTEDTNARRGSSISYQSTYQAHRRQTFHSQGPLLPSSYPASDLASIYVTDQDRLANKRTFDKGKLENIIDKQKLLRRMSIIDQHRRSSLSAGNSRRGSLRPRSELQTFIGLSKSAGLMPCPSPKQLLSLTELVVDEKEREKRILRKALSMENRTVSEDLSPEGAAPAVLFIPTSFPCDKSHLRTADDEKYKKSERRPLFRHQKSTEGMEKIEEGTAVQNIPVKKGLQEKRKSIFKQMSLDSKSLPFEKTKEVCPEEIAMVVQERRSPYLRELRSKTHDFSLDETPFATETTSKEAKPPMRRQLTTPPISESSSLKKRKSNLIRQERQEVSSSENLYKSDEKDDVQLLVLEKRDSFLRKSTQSSSDDVETAETSLTGQDTTTTVSLIIEAEENEETSEKIPYKKDENLLGASIDTTTSTSSNSTAVTNLRSDSIVSEEADKSESKAVKSEEINKKDCISEEEKREERKERSGSKEKLIGTSSEDCCDTSEEDTCQKPEKTH